MVIDNGVELTTILIDFDGVISKNALEIILDFSYDFINRYQPLPFEFLRNYLKTTSAFRLDNSVKLLFHSLGLEKHLEEYSKSLSRLSNYNKKQIKIEKDFQLFIDYCKKHDIKIYVFSLASDEDLRMSLIKPLISNQQLIKNKNMAKSDPLTFTSIISSYQIQPEKCMYIEDHPLALRAGKISGLYTCKMLNNIFTLDDTVPYEKWVDLTVLDFQSIIERWEA